MVFAVEVVFDIVVLGLKMFFAFDKQYRRISFTKEEVANERVDARNNKGNPKDPAPVQAADDYTAKERANGRSASY